MHNDTDKRRVGTLYCIGIGPGDPGLITVRGMELIQNTARNGGNLFAPAGKLKKGSLVKSILENSGTDTAAWTELEFPMSSDPAVLQDKWKEAARRIAPPLLEGHDGVFLTLGDPSVYSTWIYLRREIEAGWPEIKCHTVPGIQTANAAAAAHGIPLIEGKERYALMPAPEDAGELREILPLFDTVILYKLGHRFPSIRSFLIQEGLAASSYYSERLGLPDELNTAGLENLPETVSGYLSTIIIKTGRNV